MESTKEEIISLIKHLPDDISLEDIMEALYVKQRVLRGEKEYKDGEFYTEEEAREYLKKWLI